VISFVSGKVNETTKTFEAQLPTHHTAEDLLLKVSESYIRPVCGQWAKSAKLKV